MRDFSEIRNNKMVNLLIIKKAALVYQIEKLNSTLTVKLEETESWKQKYLRLDQKF